MEITNNTAELLNITLDGVDENGKSIKTELTVCAEEFTGIVFFSSTDSVQWTVAQAKDMIAALQLAVAKVEADSLA